MRVEITERFLNDLSALQPGLSKKCRDILRGLRKSEAKELLQGSTPGWRVHKLKSSPFRSFSVDMNYRILVKFEGDVAFVHRVVKHDLADSPDVNRNDNTNTIASVGDNRLLPSEVAGALASLGLPEQYAQSLAAIQTEDDLLDALSLIPDSWASVALDLYEASTLHIPHAHYRLLQNDDELQELLSNRSENWDLYLHPSQRYIAVLPVEQRAAVTGSAGTGKTICAWYRMQALAEQGKTVAFVAPNPKTLEISRAHIERLVGDSATRCYYFVPRTAAELCELARTVEHVIIDEGQEFSPEWYRELSRDVQAQKTGLSIFYDMNQLRGNIKKGDHLRYRNRETRWSSSFASLHCAHLCLTLNYRNSREIAAHYTRRLSAALLQPLEFELAVFETGEVVEKQISDSGLVPLIFACLQKLKRNFKDEEIAVLAVQSSQCRRVIEALRHLGLICTDTPGDRTGLCVVPAADMRGYERKAVIVFGSREHLRGNNFGNAIDTYIACSRPRDQLIVIETP